MRDMSVYLISLGTKVLGLNGICLMMVKVMHLTYVGSSWPTESAQYFIVSINSSLGLLRGWSIRLHRTHVCISAHLSCCPRARSLLSRWLKKDLFSAHLSSLLR